MASITLRQFMDLGDLLKPSRGEMPEFVNVHDLSGMIKFTSPLFFILLQFSDAWQSKVYFVQRIIDKISGNQRKRMLDAIRGKQSWESLNSDVTKILESKVKHSLTRDNPTVRIRMKIKV